MPTRDRLLQRADVPDEDIDDIIEIAARLQDEARAAREGRATLGEVQAVAAELDIAPEHVEAAIAALGRRRAADADAAREAEAAAAQRAARGRARLWTAAGAGAALLGMVFVAGWVGGGDVSAAARAARAAEGRVHAAIDRQASLAPQIAGLAGADGGDLAALQDAVRAAPTLNEKLRAADGLSAAMATSVGRLPPPQTDADRTLRTQLTDELTGSSNRVGVELGRYRSAEQEWAAAADGGLGGLGVTLGFAEAPPAPGR